MSAGINITFPKSEQDKFRKWVNSQTRETQTKCKELIERRTKDLHRRVVNSANFLHTTIKKKGKYVPKSKYSYGNLKGTISMSVSGDRLSGGVFVHAEYAPYMEFGTGRFAHIGIMPGYESYARQFKGRGIRDVNVYPKMYFFPHFERSKKLIIQDLNKMGFK